MFARISTVSVISLSTLCFLATVQAEPLDAAWPQWRGPQRDGRFIGTEWPSGLAEDTLVERWSVPQGPSYSGPVVVDDRVFVTETRDKKYEVVRALQRATGEQLWETQWEGSMTVPFFAASNGSWIRSTPSYDDGHLYVAGMRDVLVCLNAVTGEIVWKVDFVKQTGASLPSFGCASSPLVHDGHVFMQAGASLAKLNKQTGEVVWQTLKDGGGMLGGAFSSPIVATIGGVPQLVVQTRSHMAGVNSEDGSVLWTQEIPAFRGMNILPPTVIGDAVFTSSYGGKSTLFDISTTADGWQVKERWSHKSQGYMSSPVVIDGHIYLHLRNQRFVCLDAESGAEAWTTKPFGKYWSMVANGKQLLALDENGELLLIEASPQEFRLVDRRRVANDSWAHLAVVGNQLFVRDLAAIKRFDWQ